MTTFCWNDDKNELLIRERNISFEDIVSQIKKGRPSLRDIVDHPNTDKYPNQKMFIIEFNGYLYQVPFVESIDGIFLKTIIPNRKLKKKYNS